jgi:hypothetical protein
MAVDRHRRRSARGADRRVCGRDRLARLRLPAFQRRLGAKRAALIVAGFWALWHLPYFFLVSSYRGFGPFTLVGFTIGIVSGSVVLTWLYYGAGQSILAVAVWHATYDMATSGTSGTIQAIVSALVIAQAIVLWRLHDRSIKHGSRPVLGLPADKAPTEPKLASGSYSSVTPELLAATSGRQSDGQLHRTAKPQ